MNCTLPTLNTEALHRSLLGPVGEYQRVDVVDEIGSTNAELANSAASQPENFPDRSVLMANSQVAGKGRLDRVWEVPAGTAMISSVLLRPSECAAQIGAPQFASSGYGWLSVIAGVALCQAVTEESGVLAVLKWPNDVLVEGRKLSGILAQMVPVQRVPKQTASAPEVPTQTGQRPSEQTQSAQTLSERVPSAPMQGPAVVVGAGVNISQTREQLPVDRATSLLLEGGTQLDRNQLLPAYLNRFARLYRGFVSVGGDAWRPVAGGESIHGLASGLMSTLGTSVRAELPGGVMLYGTAAGLNLRGELEIHGDDGSVHVVSAGDVVHLRRVGGGGIDYA
ncbi:biotin--[acetyl-CoA-carboxylase] ligase [Arthrobacter cryoconiti]|uniref:biotin--[biotin carboxyl-carrier protein] ligase n=1 Tax=Arthrobacter cryoconiti TaxID=748907 RepID=A0ABV8R2T0_9MICC|nr:biotin--[acetyl-CoA-carboxylase] ligase [Arthrobacter cryoconiti]MCC9067070.1 biotin--[acetyl-CoA-carboxylase] ligase [Arthrobacter cryoconiti]